MLSETTACRILDESLRLIEAVEETGKIYFSEDSDRAVYTLPLRMSDGDTDHFFPSTRTSNRHAMDFLLT